MAYKGSVNASNNNSMIVFSMDSFALVVKDFVGINTLLKNSDGFFLMIVGHCGGTF